MKYWNKSDDENLQKELVALEETMKLQGIYNIFTLDMESPIIEDRKESNVDENNNIDNKESNNELVVHNENIFVKIKNIIIKFFKRFGKKD